MTKIYKRKTFFFHNLAIPKQNLGTERTNRGEATETHKQNSKMFQMDTHMDGHKEVHEEMVPT